MVDGDGDRRGDNISTILGNDTVDQQQRATQRRGGKRKRSEDNLGGTALCQHVWGWYACCRWCFEMGETYLGVQVRDELPVAFGRHAAGWWGRQNQTWVARFIGQGRWCAMLPVDVLHGSKVAGQYCVGVVVASVTLSPALGKLSCDNYPRDSCHATSRPLFEKIPV